MSDVEILCVGMALVDILVSGVETLPDVGETGLVSDLSFSTGGDAINQAIALAKLGNKVGLMSVIGTDGLAQLIQEHCETYGVATTGLCVDPTQPTSAAVALIDKQGRQRFLVSHQSAVKNYGLEQIDLDLIQPGLKVLCIGSLFLSPRFDLEALTPLLSKAKSVGAITLADMVMDQRGYGLDDLADAWPWLDYVLPSELEARTFIGSDDPAVVAANFRARGVKNVILKRGTDGVIAFIDDQELAQPAFPVVAKDTTGAGDNFVAGFIHGLLHDMPLDATLRFASAVAALSVTEVGAGAGLRDIEQVQAFLVERQDHS